MSLSAWPHTVVGLMVCMLHQPFKLGDHSKHLSPTIFELHADCTVHYCVDFDDVMIFHHPALSQFLTSSIFWFSDRKRVEPIANLQVWMLTKQHPLALVTSNLYTSIICDQKTLHRPPLSKIDGMRWASVCQLTGCCCCR